MSITTRGQGLLHFQAELKRPWCSLTAGTVAANIAVVWPVPAGVGAARCGAVLGCGWIAVVATFPIRDSAGNALVGFRFGVEDELVRPVELLTASLVVVIHSGAVLMMFDSWRKQWELPGGRRERDETARQAAVRELHEETGIQAVDLTFVAVAEFDLVAPERREMLAIYRLHLQAVPVLTVNDEALDFRWWSPASPVDDDMSPLDAEIARRAGLERHVRAPWRSGRDAPPR